MDNRPHLLPKLRSSRIMGAMKNYPCTLRIASFIPGHTCSPQSTVVGVHLPVMGKGIGTKVTDMAVVAGCAHCHDLVDGRDNRVNWIATAYPAALHMRYVQALVETHALLLEDEILTVKNGKFI